MKRREFERALGAALSDEGFVTSHKFQSAYAKPSGDEWCLVIELAGGANIISPYYAYSPVGLSRVAAQHFPSGQKLFGDARFFPRIMPRHLLKKEHWSRTGLNVELLEIVVEACREVVRTRPEPEQPLSSLMQQWIESSEAMSGEAKLLIPAWLAKSRQAAEFEQFARMSRDFHEKNLPNHRQLFEDTMGVYFMRLRETFGLPQNPQ